MTETKIARLEERLEALDRLVHSEAAAHARKDDAAFQEITQRLESLNQVRRDQIEDRAQFLRRDYYDEAHDRLQTNIHSVEGKIVDRKAYEIAHQTLADRVSAIERYYSESAGLSSGAQAAAQRLYVAAGLLIAVISVLVTIVLATR